MNTLWEIYGMRKYLQLSQQQLADKIGFSRSAVNDIENMRRNPSASFLVAFNSTFEKHKTDEFYLFLDRLKEIVHKYPL